MKKFFFFTTTVLTIIMVASCNSGTSSTPKSASPSDEYISGLTSSDSTQMKKLCNDCMELLKHRDIDAAVSMLQYYDEATHNVLPLSTEERARMMRLFVNFPVLSYNCKETTFIEEGVNNVKYEVMFDLEDHAKTSFMFNPVKVNGTWYLTVKRPDQRVSADDAPAEGNTDDAESTAEPENQ